MFESCRPDHKENKGLDVKSRPFFHVRPAGRTHLEVQVLYALDRGKR